MTPACHFTQDDSLGLEERYPSRNGPLSFKSLVLLIGDNADHAEIAVNALQHFLPQIEVEAALLGQSAFLQAKRIQVVRDWGKEPYEAWVDGMRLGQVLVNLFSNAIEAMSEGGELKVSLERQVLQNQEWLSIAVADTGCGIPPQELVQVFDPFFTTKKSGMGLGLAIAHRLIELYQGRIEVRSQVGQGTTFTVLLPVTPLMEAELPGVSR
ncbi:MAG: GHKL domain-containing protein [Candidatus Tectomicrobia bacterium]|uniref:histidine kinase n=1 Tax=Tectimicrobiota bacterium TaxID=2528274 RepID=A0A932CP71_UNCTE|nr:GHKL domain-containing protein [Candidatus Tectomicrobia bacterium]